MSSEAPLAHAQRQAPAPKAEKSQAELRTALEKRLLATKPRIDEAIAQYEQALTDNTFEDAPDEAAGSGEKRQEAMQKKLLSMIERAEKMRVQLDSEEELKDTPEADIVTLEPFFVQTWKAWGTNAKIAEETVQTAELIPPSALDFSTFSTDIDPTEFGKYILNPEVQGLDFDKLNPFIPDLSQFEAKPGKPAAQLHEVLKYVADTYGEQYYIPGIEYWKWLIENPTKDPHDLTKKVNQYYFFPGSVLRDRGGYWRVPCALWHGSEWRRRADWLASGWDSNSRVVLLER